MRCAWDELIRLLPHTIQNDVNIIGRETLQELRLRVGQPVNLVCSDKNIYLSIDAKQEFMLHIINGASQYSPWTAQSSAYGYITAPGGHRIGICGEAVLKNGIVQSIGSVNSLCIRIARDLDGISDKIIIDGTSILIIGPPGSGKTTLLRDVIRRYSSILNGSIAVLDERGEIFPLLNGKSIFHSGINTDIMSNCPKVRGIEMLLRTMGPRCIAVDEITNEEDCGAIIDASNCGISLIATAHAHDISDIRNRPIYKTLMDNGVFRRIIILNKNKTWVEERI